MVVSTLNSKGIRFSAHIFRARYNEKLRLVERQLQFNLKALLKVIAPSAGQTVDAIHEFVKIAEGGSYRVFEATFIDGPARIARLPYPCTIPRNFGVASEVATMRYLRNQGLSVPQVFAWDASNMNMGKNSSTHGIVCKCQRDYPLLSRLWSLEVKLFNLRLPAHGSIYFEDFLDLHNIDRTPIDSEPAGEGRFCIGPSAQHMWWYRGRDELTCNRGPCEF